MGFITIMSQVKTPILMVMDILEHQEIYRVN